MGTTDKMTLKGSSRRVSGTVTDELVKLAKPRDSGHCMIADAVKVAIPEAKHVSVDLATIRFTDPTKRLRYIYLTPQSVQQALLRFDQGLTIEPFNFLLRRPAQILESGYKTKSDGTRKRPSQKQRGMTSPGRVVNSGLVPTRLGGTPPPNGALATTRGRIRAFGLRQSMS